MNAEIQQEDLDIALPIIKNISPKIIVEIGTYLGGSACLWRDEFEPELLVTIDNVQRCPPVNGAETIIGDSKSLETVDQVKELLKDKEIDFLFIDGDHHADAVEADFKLYAPLVRLGGLVMFHDVLYRNAENDVPTFWKQIKRNYSYIEIGGNYNTTGVGIIKKDQPYERTEYGNIT